MRVVGVAPGRATSANCSGHAMMLDAKKNDVVCVEESVLGTRRVPHACVCGVYDKHAHAKQFEGCAGGWGAGLGCGSMMPIYLSDIS